ncbi:MAG: hypothetical protein LUI14_01845 [Lachnospiraceae bacterium]|nr:hypothetical protein [Lachnospiraceae bacterium]
MWIRIERGFSKKAAGIVKTLIFVFLAAALFVYINQLVQPIWTSWSNYDRTEGFYEEPENTLETVFVGTSVVVTGIIPAELYEDYGICAYNLASEQQPMLASYYWVEEAFRLHSESMTTVVLDVSALRFKQDDAFYRKALDGMRLSTIKLHAVKDYASDFSEMISMLIPVFSYHDRWEELTETDFTKNSLEPERCLRGLCLNGDVYAEQADDYTEIAVPEYEINEEASAANLENESVTYLMKMIEFCEEQDLNLVLIKTPVLGNWSSSLHNAVQEIADTYGLDFMDFNYSPYFDEISFNNATDTKDGQHLNYFGAAKLTAFLGEYLSEVCKNTDHRGDEAYAFLDEQLEEYQSVLASYLETNEVINLEESLAADLEAGVEYEDLTEAEQRLYQYNLTCEGKKQMLQDGTDSADGMED